MNAPHSITAKRIAESIVSVIEWQSSAKAFCICPGEDLHTTPNGSADCVVIVETLPDGCLPGVYCFHDSCAEARDEANRKLRQSLRNMAPGAIPPPLATTPRKPKPVYRPEVLARVAAKGPRVTPDYLAKCSPMDPRTVSPELFLFSLYQPGERVLLFGDKKSQGHVWRHPGSLEKLNERELDCFKTGARVGVYFLCNPVSGKWAPKRDNPKRKTRRESQCVTSFRYIMFESDEVTEDLWLAAIVQFQLPIVAIYRSAGSSVHVLVRLNASTEKEWRAMREILRERMIPLGADKRSNSPTQLTRLPGCERLGKEGKGGYVAFEKPRLQELLYLAPDADCAPIVEKGVCRE